MTKIMIAEDDNTLRTMISLILEMRGFEVFSYPNGRLALNAFPAIAPDLVVSDIGMPVLDGFGLLAGVRNYSTGSVVPFLFLSAHSEQEDVNSARRLGADDFLVKPFAPDDLVDAVMMRIERRRMAEIFDTHQVQKHTVAGAHIIDGVSHLREARPYILYHHEKWNGMGYPDGLKGVLIPPEGRLLAIVDVFDALTSERPYHRSIAK